ncbi:phosphatidate cytidylyltransferase, mitochondrial-like [Dysidea avara]|uniref:phosphatidate cytidylyltransferase, mitochondrial-like n=1 Tax=Dysidea avara TaxID=196820 RepID=UPI003318AA00
MHPVTKFYDTIRLSFPKVAFSFAYGSAVFKQLGRPLGHMLDFIFAVDDPVSWHKQNLKWNSTHYSFLRHLGAGSVVTVQSWAGQIYYNSLVEMNGKLIKYGVVSVHDMCHDLRHWNTLYVSGRLHKPVLMLEQAPPPMVSAAIATNLSMAVHSSLLMLPEKFSKEQLYTTIAGLSYQGDFRMIVGEDKNKVRNIVTPHLGEFHHLYSNTINSDYISIGSDHIIQDKSTNATVRHLTQLPSTIQDNLLRYTGLASFSEENVQRIAEDTSLPEHVHKSIKRVVARISLNQSLKGILTAGISKSVLYSGKKLQKMKTSTVKK